MPLSATDSGSTPTVVHYHPDRQNSGDGASGRPNRFWSVVLTVVHNGINQFYTIAPFVVMDDQAYGSSGRPQHRKGCSSGTGCSKLTMSLINVSLKFQSFLKYLKLCQFFFLLKKM